MGLYFLLKNQKGWQNQVLVVQHGDYCPKPGLAVALALGLQLLSPPTTTTEAQDPRICALQQEKPVHCN